MKNKVKNIFISFCIIMAIGLDMPNFSKFYLSTEKFIPNGSNLLKIDMIILIILSIYIYSFLTKNKKKSNKVIDVLSIIFSLIMIFGCSYKYLGNGSLVFGCFIFFIISIIMAIGYFFIFRISLCYVFEWLDKYKDKDSKMKVMEFFKKHPFIISIIVMIICWLPVILIFYPAILSPDPSNQIMQFFGIKTKYADFSILLDESVVLTNHHPVVHTFLLGGCIKLGKMLVNVNFGLFIYSLIQIIVLSGTLAYTIKYMMKDLNISNKYGLIALIIYSFVPMFPFYAMSPVKDVFYSCFVIMYVIMLHKIIIKKGENFKIWHYILMVLIMLLVVLFRNNGIHLIVLSFPFLIWAVRKHWKPFLTLFLILIFCNFIYKDVLLPAFKITPSSIREMLSIPFQQTARYVYYYSNELSDEDKEVIDKVLVYKDIASRYNPELSDNVKGKFNKYADKEDLKEYFKLWFKGLIKHPNIYIDATINNTYGFFYPEKLSWSLYHNYNNSIVYKGYDYHFVSLEKTRNDYYKYAETFREIPVIGLISNIGFNTWIVFILTGYCIYKKKYKMVVLYLPALITILICVAGPANAYFRYVLPYVFAMPLLISFCISKKI